MFAEQFKWTERLLGERPDPLLLYCAETALQIHITELSPELRELYMTAYSLQSTSEYIYQNISKEAGDVFSRRICRAHRRAISTNWRLPRRA